MLTERSEVEAFGTLRVLEVLFQVKLDEPMIEPIALAKRTLVEAIPVMAKAVVVAFVVVLLDAVTFWRVVLPATNRSPEELMVVVAVPPA